MIPGFYKVWLVYCRYEALVQGMIVKLLSLSVKFAVGKTSTLDFYYHYCVGRVPDNM